MNHLTNAKKIVSNGAAIMLIAIFMFSTGSVAWAHDNTAVDYGQKNGEYLIKIKGNHSQVRPIFDRVLRYCSDFQDVRQVETTASQTVWAIQTSLMGASEVEFTVTDAINKRINEAEHLDESTLGSAPESFWVLGSEISEVKLLQDLNFVEISDGTIVFQLHYVVTKEGHMHGDDVRMHKVDLNDGVEQHGNAYE